MALNRVSIIFGLFWVAMALLGDSFAWSAGVSPEVQSRWITPLGRPVQLSWKVQSAWIWKNYSYGNQSIKRPVLRTWIELPENLVLRSAKTDDGTVTKEVEDPPSGPSDRWIAIDSIKSSVSVMLILESPKKTLEIGLLLTDNTRRPIFLVDDSCVDTGVRFQKLKDKGLTGGTVLGVSCYYDPNGQTGIYFFSRDSSEIKLTLPKEQLGSGWVRGRMSEPKNSTKGHDHVVKISQGDASSYYSIRSEQRAWSRWRFFFGLGPTYFSYKDYQVPNVTLSAIALTAKGGVNYRLGKRWDLGFSAFGTVLNFSSSIEPAEYPVARFLGANLRVGFSILNGKKFSLKLSPGLYYWGMIVPQSAYGIIYMAGPQIFLSSTFAIAPDRKMSAYLKFAPIAAGLTSLTLGSREIAVGLGYPLNSARAKVQWALTLDLSQLSISENTSPTKPSLFTVSLGTQLAF